MRHETEQLLKVTLRKVNDLLDALIDYLKSRT